LLLVFWVLFPRVPGPFWAVPKEQSAAVTGISDTISPGDISQLSESDAVAFRVRFDGASPPRSQLYWRGPVLQAFNGRSWTVASIGQDPPARNAVQPLASPVTYTVALDPTNQRWLFALDMPVEWDLPAARMVSSQQLVTWRPIEDRTSYTATSYLTYRVNGPTRDAVRRSNLKLPPGRNPEARAFAESLLAQSGGDPGSYVAAVLKHFRDEPFFYTLRPPPLGADSVDEFLFGTRRGFCEHYASSFAFLMRAAGIPARVVVGYLGGEPNSYGDYWMVRQSDAHAWTEVWLAERGWVRIDPTAEVSALRIEAGLDAALDAIGERRGSRLFDVRLMQNLELIWDTVNARWDEWVLGYGPETQRRFLQWLGMRDPSWQKMVAWLGALALFMLAVLTWRLARRFRRADPDAALRIYRRTTEALAPGTAATVSPERLHRDLVERYPDLAAQLRRFTDDYLSLRYAGDGSVETLRASAQSLSRAAAAAPATTTAHR
ncbi:MAG: DUF3488 and transglutaminase-like domain-containing protein, partial [Pseudomonadota bacterium]